LIPRRLKNNKLTVGAGNISGICVSWNVGGKITRVYKNAGSQPHRWMSFDYDVMGNRLMKRLDKATSLYVRDAKGNTMAVYEVKTEKKDGDTDAQAGQKLESFLAALYDQMPGAVNQVKTLNFIKYFIRPIEGANEQKITEIRNLLDGVNGNGQPLPPTQFNNRYNQVRIKINELTGYDAPTNRDIFGANAEQYFRNHPWNPNILPQNLARTRHKTLRQKEVHLYGSSRLGVAQRRTAKNENTYLVLSEIRVQEVENPFVAGNISGIFVGKIADVAYTVPEENRFISRLGMKRYELVNHLGNVQAVISDRNIPHRVSPQIPAIDYYTADLLSATDYYPFGMTMAGRSLNTDDYRYGFNGKEFDHDWDGGGATYDYGFRIYDPRVARFLSVDPLTQKYPGITPYAYAENDAVRCIDMDGLEKIDVNIDSSPINGTPGRAKITISLDYQVITEGPGKVEKTAGLNPNAFHQLYQKGNTTLKLKTLPSQSSEAVVLTRKEERQIKKGKKQIDYYEVKVEYNYTLRIEEGMNALKARASMGQDIQGKGIVLMPRADEERKGFVGVGDKDASVKLSDPKNLEASSIGDGFNVVFLSPLYFGVNSKAIPSGNVSPIEIVVHGAGHNSANAHSHKFSDYQYNQIGLQSNQPGQVFPTKENTLDIINDKANRKTIK